MKQVKINGDFSGLELDAEPVGNGTASTLRAAISRAVADLFKNPELKGKRVSNFVLSVSVENV